MTDFAERVETRIAFLESSSTELSDVVYRQQREIEALRAQLTRLASRLDAMVLAGPDTTVEDEKPPHY